MSLTRRLVLTVVALVVAVSLLVAGAATLVMRAYLTDRLDAELAQSTERARVQAGGNPVGDGPGGPFGSRPRPSALCGEPPRPSLGQSARSLTAVYTDDCRAGVQITESAGLRPLSSSALDALADVDPDDEPLTVDLPGLGSVRVAATTTADGTVVVQGLPTGDLDETLTRLLWWEALLTVLGAAAAGLVGVVLVRRQLRPLREVAATAHEVTTLPLDSGEVGRTVRVPEKLTDPGNEVGQVGEALNRLLTHVEQALDARHESEQQVRQFLADASHELRTPLSTIRGYAELGRRTGTDQLTKVESEAARMSTLVDDMLLLARLDSGRPLEREPVDLSLLLAESVSDARVVDGGHTWRLELPDEPIEVPGDALRLHQAVTNLLGNASRHTPPGTVVTARLRLPDADHAVVEVHDDGPGIGPDLLPVVFERFTRGDSSRTRESGGAGLGTSLVAAIAEAHGGTVAVTSEPGSTTFGITLPRT
ncbi:HAMP domain-containing sensor histidine kinase [Cytobacillus oceanisediminis]